MNNSSNITVIKIGGSTLGETDSTFADIASLHKKGWKVVLIHGGGKEIYMFIYRRGTIPPAGISTVTPRLALNEPWGGND